MKNINKNFIFRKVEQCSTVNNTNNNNKIIIRTIKQCVFVLFVK